MSLTQPTPSRERLCLQTFRARAFIFCSFLFVRQAAELKEAYRQHGPVAFVEHRDAEGKAWVRESENKFSIRINDLFFG